MLLSSIAIHQMCLSLLMGTINLSAGKYSDSSVLFIKNKNKIGWFTQPTFKAHMSLGTPSKFQQDTFKILLTIGRTPFI